MVSAKDIQFLKSPVTTQQAIDIAQKFGSGGGGGGRTPVNYNFSSVDGDVGITITHNLGYRPAVVSVGALDSTGNTDNVSFGNVQHISVNQFKINWLGGVATGSVTY